jgi:hypothetical protein
MVAGDVDSDLLPTLLVPAMDVIGNEGSSEEEAVDRQILLSELPPVDARGKLDRCSSRLRLPDRKPDRRREQG